MEDHAIVLFDGVCNFCNTTVNFIMDHDPKGYFTFAALQSEAGKRISTQYRIDTSNLDTLILIEEGTISTHSTAVLKMFRRLPGWYSIFYDFIIIPVFIRDPFYQLFAKMRYSLFGRRNICRVPTKEESARFII